MFCTNCGKPIADDVKFCPLCGSKVSSDTQEKQEAPVEVSPAKAETSGNQTPVRDRKKLLIGGIIAAVAVIAIVLISVLGTNVNKDIDPKVISGVEERAISELNNNSMKEIEDQLKDLYPSYTWKCMPPNKNSNLKSPKELGTDDGIYKLEVFVDINLYGSSGNIAGYTAARLKADVKLTNKKGAYQISNAVVAVDSSPYMVEQDEPATIQTQENPSTASQPSSSNVSLDLFEGFWICEDESDVIRITVQGDTLHITKFDTTGEIIDELDSSGQVYSDSESISTGVSSSYYDNEVFSLQMDYNTDTETIYLVVIYDGHASMWPTVYYYLENGWDV